MKTRLSLLFGVGVGLALAGESSVKDKAVQKAVGSQPVCITPKPLPMPPGISLLCVAPVGRDFRQEAKEEYGPHSARWAQVFTNAVGEAVYRSGEGQFPVGSVIVKAKSVEANGNVIELFTIMRKQKPGYAPQQGDWEYAVADADGVAIAKGRIESCVQCHDRFAKSDYVARWVMRPAQQR
jgi:hypothetical protein